MIGILAVIWGLLLLWSLGGSIPGINWVMPGNPPPLRYVFWAGVGVFLAYFLWPWIRGLGRGATPTAPTPGAATVRLGLTWGQWFVVTFIVAPLLIPAFLLVLYIGLPELYNFVWTNNGTLAAGIVLASLLYGLTPPHDPDFLKGVTKWLLIVTVVMVGIRFSAFWLTGGTYYSGVLSDGQIVLRPYPGPIGEEGDTIRINGVRGGYSFRKTLLNPNANPDSFSFIGIKGDPVLVRRFHLGLPDEPVGKLIYQFDGGQSFASFRAKTAEIKISKRSSIDFFFNEEDKILKDSQTEGEVWLIVYINPQLTPGGWAEASAKRFKATLGALVFVVLAFLAIGLIWYFVPSNLGKQVAVVVAIVAIFVIGWGIWGTREAQKKQEYKKEWRQKVQETTDDPFASPTEKMKARQAQETDNEPAQPESSFERAQRTVSVNTGPFKIAGGLILILALLAGVKKFVS